MRRMMLLVGVAALAIVAFLAVGVSGRAGTGFGESVAFIDTLAYSDGDLHTVRTDGSRQRLLVRGAEDPAWSRDGRQIAYSSNDWYISFVWKAGKRTSIPGYAWVYALNERGEVVGSRGDADANEDYYHAHRWRAGTRPDKQVMLTAVLWTLRHGT